VTLKHHFLWRRSGVKWAQCTWDGRSEKARRLSPGQNELPEPYTRLQPVENQILLSRKANWTITSHKDDRCAFACHLQTAAQEREWPQLQQPLHWENVFNLFQTAFEISIKGKNYYNRCDNINSVASEWIIYKYMSYTFLLKRIYYILLFTHIRILNILNNN